MRKVSFAQYEVKMLHISQDMNTVCCFDEISQIFFADFVVSTTLKRKTEYWFSVNNTDIW